MYVSGKKENPRNEYFTCITYYSSLPEFNKNDFY